MNCENVSRPGWLQDKLKFYTRPVQTWAWKFWPLVQTSSQQFFKDYLNIHLPCQKIHLPVAVKWCIFPLLDTQMSSSSLFLLKTKRFDFFLLNFYMDASLAFKLHFYYFLSIQAIYKRLYTFNNLACFDNFPDMKINSFI